MQFVMSLVLAPHFLAAAWADADADAAVNAVAAHCSGVAR
jgi:hypothetical protein